MQTRTIILTGQKDDQVLMGILSVKGDSDMVVSIKVYDDNITDCMLAFCMGDTNYTQRDVNLNDDYNFEINNVNIDEQIKIGVFDKNNQVLLSNNLAQQDIEYLQSLLLTEKEAKVYTSTLNEKENTNSCQQGDDNQSFFDMIAKQFETLINNGKPCKEVEKLIPNSQWAYVPNDENDAEPYIVGRIFNENGETQFVCYGVPAQNQDEAVNVDKNYGQWLPLDNHNPSGKGYYLMYQDAQTGENIKI